MRMGFRGLALVLCCVLALAGVSCGADGLGGAGTPTPPLVVTTPTMLPLPENASTAARIRALGHIRVGVRYDDDPFGIVNDQGDLLGFDVDLAREFASRWLGDPGAVRFVQVTNDTVTERVRTGLVDMVIAALPPNKSAAADVAYSAPYYYDGLALAVRAPGVVTGTVTVQSPADLDGVAVAVVEEADTEAALRRVAGAAAPSVVYYPDYFSAVAGLETGVVEAVVGPRRTLVRLAAGTGDLGLTPYFTRDPYAIGLPKSDSPFRHLVNATLMELIRDGTYGRLFARWFPDETPPDLEVWTGTSRSTFDSLDDTLAPMEGSIQDIEQGGYLMVGLVDDRLPFTDFDANGVARGFEAELARAFAGRWLDDVNAVQFVRHSEESGVAALMSGQIDLLVGALPHTLPRDDDIDFSQTVYRDGVGLLVSADGGIAGTADLDGGIVAAPAAGLAGEALQAAAAQAGIALTIQRVDDPNLALAGLADGRYRAYADWRTELLNLAYANAGFLVLDERLTRRPLALGLRQGDVRFRDLVNFTLQELAEEGRFGALYDDWFGTDPPYDVEIWRGTPYLPLKLKRPALAIPTATPGG
jgi:ABC-type amino acid transport substrate-binding protein